MKKTTCVIIIAVLMEFLLTDGGNAQSNQKLAQTSLGS